MRFLFIILFSLFLCSCNSDNDPISPPEEEEEEQEEISNYIEISAEIPMVWQYFEDDEMFSRNGNQTGFLTSINPNSNKLIVYLEGGGACFNTFTCDSNRESFSENDGQNYSTLFNFSAPSLLFDRVNNLNNFRDWNYVFVPYSTGDVHSGVNQSGDVENGGPQNQKFVGSNNLSIIVNELKEHFDNNLTDIVVTGSSAGGYGTYLGFTQVANAFPNASMTGLVDAGPLFFNEEVFNDCLANTWDNLFQFNYPDDYDEIVTTNYNQKLQGIYEYLSKKYPEANFGLISDTYDEVIRYFFGFGLNNCNGQPALINPNTFYDGLLEIEEQLNSFNNWSVYYAPTDNHTFLGGERVLNTSVNNKVLIDWINDLNEGTAIDVIP